MNCFVFVRSLNQNILEIALSPRNAGLNIDLHMWTVLNIVRFIIIIKKVALMSKFIITKEIHF